MHAMKENKNLVLHLKTADMLVEGIKEAVTQNNGKPFTPQEYSRESVKRRCIQARKELLRVMQEVDYKWID